MPVEQFNDVDGGVVAALADQIFAAGKACGVSVDDGSSVLVRNAGYFGGKACLLLEVSFNIVGVEVAFGDFQQAAVEYFAAFVVNAAHAFIKFRAGIAVSGNGFEQAA